MRRYVGFALVGLVAVWLVSFLPPSMSTLSIALVIGLGAAGGNLAREPGDIAALAVGAVVGAASSGLTQAQGTGGPGVGEVLVSAIVIAVIVAVAGFVAAFVSRARRPGPPRSR